MGQGFPPNMGQGLPNQSQPPLGQNYSTKRKETPSPEACPLKRVKSSPPQIQLEGFMPAYDGFKQRDSYQDFNPAAQSNLALSVEQRQEDIPKSKDEARKQETKHKKK